MTTSIPLLSRPGLLRLASAACLWVLPLAAASAEQPVVNWPVPTPPAGSNPAVFPVPRNDWMEHFQRSLDRTKKGQVDLIFDGDSITDFWLGAGKKVWDENYGRLKVVDYGISGDRTENLLWRVNQGEVAGLHPKLVALLIGTNDLGDCSDVQIAEGITAVVRAYQKACPAAVILLQGIFPRAESASDPQRAKIKRINASIAKLAEPPHVVYVDFGDKFLLPDGTLSHDLMPDFLHPSEKGYEVWAAAIQPEIAKIFGPTSLAR